MLCMAAHILGLIWNQQVRFWPYAARYNLAKHIFSKSRRLNIDNVV